MSIDSRTIAAGDLFVALKGPVFDGHDFAGKALAAGAAAALVHRSVDTAGPALLVGDTRTGLEDLGRAARARCGGKIIAVTGSVGKTGVKESLRNLLSKQGKTYATAGNLNNHWGAPLSLSRLPRSAIYGVFELGMSNPGELAPLSRMVRPHVALITTVAPVHVEYFDSVEAVAEAKAEIFHGVIEGGTAVLPRDNDHFDLLEARAAEAGIARRVSFGLHPDADVRLLASMMDADGSEVTASVFGKRLSFRVGVPGHHWVTNAPRHACRDSRGRRRRRRRSRSDGGPESAGRPRRTPRRSPGGRQFRPAGRKLQCQPGGHARSIRDADARQPAQRRTAHRSCWATCENWGQRGRSCTPASPAIWPTRRSTCCSPPGR